MTAQLPCPKCKSDKVGMFPTEGGIRGSGETTVYAGECDGCGYRVEGLPSNCDGRKASAIREWNRLARAGTIVPIESNSRL